MKLRKEMVKVNDKVCKGRKCFIVSMLFMLTFFFSIGFMEQSSKADTVNYSEGDFSYQLTQETKTATLQKLKVIIVGRKKARTLRRLLQTLQHMIHQKNW